MLPPLTKCCCTIGLIIISQYVSGQSQLTSDNKLSEADYYHLGRVALTLIDSAKDSISLEQAWRQADSIAKAYINAYPDMPQGYTIRVYAAKKADRDTSRGLAVGPITFANQFYWRDTAAYRKTIFANDYYLFIYYYLHCRVGDRVDQYKKAMACLGEMLLISAPGSAEYNSTKYLRDKLNAGVPVVYGSRH